jgi:hypothetical protein
MKLRNSGCASIIDGDGPERQVAKGPAVGQRDRRHLLQAHMVLVGGLLGRDSRLLARRQSRARPKARKVTAALDLGRVDLWISFHTLAMIF